MSIRVALHHKTEYKYDRPVGLSPHIIRLRPAPHCRTAVPSYALKVFPKDHFINWQQDPYGNFLARFVFPKPTDRLCIEVDLTAEMVVINPFDFFLEEQVMEFPFAYSEEVAKELIPYLETEPVGQKLAAYIATVPREKRRTMDFLVDLNQQLSQHIKYLIRLEPGIQTCEETLTLCSGSCRDTAWLLVQILRNLGLAARFVSGYLIQLTADVKAIDGPAGPEEDFTDLHAWTEVFLPGAGWVGFDPTSGLLAGEGHLPLAGTPDPASAAPVVGASEPAEVEFDFAMTVQRVKETPRISKPYTDEAWAAIQALGQTVDAAIRAADLRLTHGGEPTFVSDTDREHAQWHTEALGEEKWIKAQELFHRLADHFGPFGLHHHGEGKWYPGESLPRWSLECFWRRDGEPLWRNPHLRGDARTTYGHDQTHAATFMSALTKVLGLDAKHVLPAYEDTFYYLWRERRLPGNVDPFDSKLDDPEERARLSKVFRQGLDAVVGYTLPIRSLWNGTHWQWETGPWFLREERMYLLPGDSAMGLRLPLDSLPWEVPGLRHTSHPVDPSAYPSGAHARLFARITPQFPRPFGTSVPAQSSPVSPAPATAANTPWGPPPPPTGYYAPGAPAPTGLIRTALCIQPREGRLYAFMPPLQSAYQYFTLVSALEQAALDTQLPIIVEGYKPPHDPRIQNFNVRPDPGVIEINIHPADSWQELQDNTLFLYEAARQTRLSAEKYAIDGRATGTGGGGHIVLGGATAQDSPFLRRLSLLKGLIAYFHNHPGLSYLFTGLFVGPTSQAPRVDEARNDMVPELEVAFRQVTDNLNHTPPWLTDRIFRNLLVDVTGNTHRAELCIDKLYSPDTPEGRRGLVEMRSFEMPPHPHMALTQNLLIRALLTRLWNQPYEAPLVRWHTGLHDRYMLPHFVWNDFVDVLNDLREAGFHFDPAWFHPQHEFRFPKYGAFTQDAVHIEIRAAIEPWHVLGEQPGGGGTARYVDASLDRVQVKVSGLVQPRHVLACNGIQIPLHPTGTIGEYVAGIRFRAWQPPNCLHPTLPPDTPLILDLIDSWNKRAIAGCTIHAAHPGGLNYETFPVNANEAEARRLHRFSPVGHTPGPITAAIPRSTPEHPLTLDLRL